MFRRCEKSWVFIGPGNTAGTSYHVGNALKKARINAHSFSYRTHPFGYQCDTDNLLFKKPNSRNFFQKLLLNRLTLRIIWNFQKISIFIRALIIYDSYIFISPHTFFKSHIDLPFLRYLGKTIAFYFPGCCERDPWDSLNSEVGGFCYFCMDKNKQQFCNCINNEAKAKQIRYFEKFANIIFAQRDTIGFVRQSEKIRKLYVIADKMNASSLDKFMDINKIIICHFPSNNLIKGTHHVKKAISLLSYSNINYISDRLSNDEVLIQLEKAHILVDQFGTGHGLLAVEAMSRGCVVICRLAKWFKEDYPDIPIVSCEPEELKDVLEDLINNPEKMKSIAQQSIEYYKKYHTPEAVGNYYKEILNLH